LDTLIAAVSDPQTDMSLEGAVAISWSEQRIQAANSLGRLKDRRAVAPLLTALDSADKECKAAFVQALKDITGQDFGDNAAKWRAWWELNKGK